MGIPVILGYPCQNKKFGLFNSIIKKTIEIESIRNIPKNVRTICNQPAVLTAMPNEIPPVLINKAIMPNGLVI